MTIDRVQDGLPPEIDRKRRIFEVGIWKQFEDTAAKEGIKPGSDEFKRRRDHILP